MLLVTSFILCNGAMNDGNWFFEHWNKSIKTLLGDCAIYFHVVRRLPLWLWLPFAEITSLSTDWTHTMWRSQSTIQSPAGCASHQAILLGGVMWVMGGCSLDHTVKNGIAKSVLVVHMTFICIIILLIFLL